MRRNTAASFFPPLKDDREEWLLEPKQKADAFAEAFSSKFHLPAETQEIFFSSASNMMPDLCVIRTRHVRRELLQLREYQATGPDAIPSIFLRMLASYIALPLAIVCRRIFHEASWPLAWCTHWLIPLYKKGSVYRPS